jgi:hypothetical protein
MIDVLATKALDEECDYHDSETAYQYSSVNDSYVFHSVEPSLVVKSHRLKRAPESVREVEPQGA